MKQRYDSYKPSGIDWIGEIPSHWENTRLKFECSLKGRIGWNGLKSDEFKVESYAYLVTGQDFVGKDIDWHKCYQIDKWRYDEDPFIQLSNGDLLITKDGTIGKIALVDNLDKPACLNSGIFVLKFTSDKLMQKYLYWTLVSTQLIDFNFYRAGASTTIQHLYQNVFENMPLVVPSLPEQEAIATWLDEKCSEIDAAIAKVDREIELIDELKHSEISRVVTRGLNPDVALKSSGIDWIGEIPCHWDCVKTLFALSMPITDGPHETPTLYEDGIPFISAEAISTGKIRFDHMRGYISQAYYEECCKKYIPQRNDIYMTKSGASTGRVALVETDCIFTIWSPLAVFRANASKTDYKFLYYVLLSECYQKQVENGWSYGTQQNIGMRTLEKLKIPLPPLTEQQSISDYLDKKCAEIDGLKEKLVRKRETLKEFRQSIISEVVTGKRKVN